MLLRRHKFYKKDVLKAKLTDEQYAKKIKYLSMILNDKVLPSESLDHSLAGEYKNFREFHLGGDMLLIYTIKDNILYLQRLGMHSQLFK